MEGLAGVCQLSFVIIKQDRQATHLKRGVVDLGPQSQISGRFDACVKAAYKACIYCGGMVLLASHHDGSREGQAQVPTSGSHQCPTSC